MGVGWNQGFAFDKHKLSRVHRSISRCDEPRTIGEWKDELHMGPNSVEGHISYLKHLGVYDTKERKLTKIGSLIVESDPGWRRKGTFFILYYNLVRNESATVWYYMANTFLPRNKVFTKDEAKTALSRHIAGRKISKKNTHDDLNLYLRSVTELNAFGKLRLIRKSGDKYVRKAPTDMPPLILAYCLYTQKNEILSNQKSAKIDELLSQNKGVGKAFNLYESHEKFLGMLDILRKKDIASYTTTADLNDIGFIGTPENAIEYAKSYYSKNQT